MASSPEARSLQINEHRDFQRRQFRTAVVALAVFVVIVLAALLGCFGSGPFSTATAGNADDRFTVDYRRFLRFGGSAELAVEIRGGEGTAEVAFDESYLEGFELEGVLPEPDSQRVEGGRVLFTFEERPPSTVRVSLTPREAGLQRTGVSVSGLGSESFTQLVYP